jgi:hypothetical protein
VIKPLGKLLGYVQGSGEVALIIDEPAMLKQQERGDQQTE